MNRKLAIAALLLVACGDDPPTTRTAADSSDAGPATCDGDPDAATALGVTGRYLWDAYSDVYTFPSSRIGMRVGTSFTLEEATFTITVEPSTELPLTAGCASLSVPVRITVASAQPAVNEVALGYLSGTPGQAVIEFFASQTAPFAEQAVVGWITFLPGKAPQLTMNLRDSNNWQSPPVMPPPREVAP